MTTDFGLYVHIPFCVRKCPYCDFNSYGVGENRAAIPEEQYTSALISELNFRAEEGQWQGRRIETIFFGGGTPSLFTPQSIERVLAEAEKVFSFCRFPEISLEANPGTVSESLGAEKLKGFRGAGVNRVSFGAQSFSSKKLERLGRIHAPEETVSAFYFARAAGFENINLDLIFGVAGESESEWRNDVSEVLRLEPEHISAYSLTIEPGTEFGRKARQGIREDAGEEIQGERFALTAKLLAAKGYDRYEVSNYSKPGKECAHNRGYWAGRDYLGIGAGAHSFHSGAKSRWSNIPGPAQYIDRATLGGDAAQLRESISSEQAEIEFFFLGLRRREGISVTEYSDLFGTPFDARYARLVDTLTRENLLTRADDRLVLSEAGFLVLDSILSEFVSASA